MPKGGWRVGAGRPSNHAKVEHCRSIDIRQFDRLGILSRPWQGAWWWKDPDTLLVTSQLKLLTGHDFVKLAYTCKGQSITESFQVEHTACTYGGTRPWFQCVTCQRRVAVLHLHRGRFRCRDCHDLRYKSQSEDPIDRTWRAQRKLERKLGKHWGRPKGMHKTTMDLLVSKIIGLEMAREDLISDGLLSLVLLEAGASKNHQDSPRYSSIVNIVSGSNSALS